MKMEFDPEMDDDNPWLDEAFMAGMKRSHRGRPKPEAPKIEPLWDAAQD